MGESRPLMDDVGCFLGIVCVCAHALVCLLVFAVLNNKDCMCVCVCVSLGFCAWHSVGKMRGLRVAWNSRAWFWKKGPLHLLMCPPLYSCAASPLARTGPSIRLMVFDGQKYDRHKTLFNKQPKGTTELV